MKNCIRAAALILLSASIAAPAIAQSAGAATYKAKCAMCHGPDGTAATPMGKMMKIPSFKSPAAVKKTEAQYIAITKDGMGRMPAYKGKLSDAQIKEVVSYIRTLQKK
jgi:mono/diheme cytochrome c family protein